MKFSLLPDAVYRKQQVEINELKEKNAMLSRRNAALSSTNERLSKRLLELQPPESRRMARLSELDVGRTVYMVPWQFPRSVGETGVVVDASDMWYWEDDPGTATVGTATVSVTRRSKLLFEIDVDAVKEYYTDSGERVVR